MPRESTSRKLRRPRRWPSWLKADERMNASGELQKQFKKERDINPILPAHSADPWMIFHEGFYYHCESRRHQRIYIRKSPSLSTIGEDSGICAALSSPPA